MRKGATPGGWVLAALPLLWPAFAQASETAGTPPQAINPGSWISMDDYPAEAARWSTEGTVRVDLAVDAHGRVTGCEVRQSAGAVLDVATCRLLALRARFQPARDAGGKAMAGSYSSAIAWRLADPLKPVPFAYAQRKVVTLYQAAGAGFCRETQVGQLPDTLGRHSCAPGANAAKPPRNPDLVMRATSTLLPAADGRGFEKKGQGKFAERFRVAFEVAPSGVVVKCEPVPKVAHGADAKEHADERCEMLRARGKPLFEPALPGTQPRRGELEQSLVIDAPNADDFWVGN